MEKYTYKEMALISNTTEERFLKDARKYEQTLINKGWKFTKEGRGRKAIYYIDEDLANKNWDDMTFKERFMDLYGVSLKYPHIMQRYMTALSNNIDSIITLSDECASNIIECDRARICACRKVLENVELIIPVKFQRRGRYYIYKYDSTIKEISKKEYSEFWNYYFRCVRYRELEKDLSKTDSQIKKEELFKLEQYIGGKLVIIKTKQPAEDFNDIINLLIG